MALSNRYLRILAVSAALILAAVVAACGSDDPLASRAPLTAATEAPATPETRPATETPAVETAFPLTITDSGGTELVFEAAPRRIISFSPAATEILFAIGAGGQVIAVDEFSNYPPEIEALDRVRYSDPDPEAALVLDPDLVLFGTQQEGSVEQFRALDLRVMLSRAPESIDGVLADIELLGRVTGHAEQAEALTAEMRRRIAAVVDSIDDVREGPLVFYELTDGLYTVGPDSFIGAMLTLLKARNVAEGAVSAFPQLTSEAVIDADPAVILLADAAFGASLETLRARPGWAGIAAVASGRVYPIDPDIASRPGPRIVEAIELIARALYPDRFE